MKGDLRREQILKTAINLFSQKGFAGTTTKEIARAAGVSEAMVFRHFSKKTDLYDAILGDRECHDGMRFPWEEDAILVDAIARKDDHAVFYRLAINALNKQQADVGFMRLLFYSALEEHELAERFFGEFVARIYGFIGGYIEERQRDGTFRSMNPRVAVRAFLGMLIHHSINVILWDKGRNLLDISNEEAADSFARILLEGIRA
ncbi:MAG TPA: TetR/AcrR family transcriptional regulator [Pyrinomonadaceae bacterium]|jgi:AcrR family transcriptional regulator|nr:TetR/AcrR family transcriptional regulator [Pyrinomonadaceae bacterium]